MGNTTILSRFFSVSHLVLAVMGTEVCKWSTALGLLLSKDHIDPVFQSSVEHR